MFIFYLKVFFGVSMKQFRLIENIWFIYKDFKYRYVMILNMYNFIEVVNKLINEEYQKKDRQVEIIVFELKRVL